MYQTKRPQFGSIGRRSALGAKRMALESRRADLNRGPLHYEGLSRAKSGPFRHDSVQVVGLVSGQICRVGDIFRDTVFDTGWTELADASYRSLPRILFACLRMTPMIQGRPAAPVPTTSYGPTPPPALEGR